MAEEARFHERQIDRTAYGALWTVLALAVMVWAAAAWGVWQIGNAFQRREAAWSWHWPSLSVPKPADVLDSEKQKADQAASNSIHSAASSAATAAASAAASSADQQLNQFLNK